MKKNILLIYPSCEPDNDKADSDFSYGLRNIPIGILSIATFIKREGYDVSLIDCRLHSKRKIIELIDEKINSGTICVGLSMMTMQISHGLRIIDHIKKKTDIPIVLGGIHCTLFPEQTIGEKNVDFVVVGEGEYSFFELIRFLDRDGSDGLAKDLADIKGLCFKRGDDIVINPVADPLDISDMPFPDYEILEDIETYIKRRFYNADGSFFETRTLDVHTSRGCPYQCTFCINTLPCFKKWRTKKIEDILEHIDFIIQKYDLDFIWFMDDFFFGDIKRVKRIAQHLIEKGHNIRWEATIRANLFKDRLVDDATLKLLKDSGCYSLGLGYESGSNRILKKIKKYITTDEIIHSVVQCKKYDIIPRGSFMCGFPTETKHEVMMTGDLILHLKKIFPLGIFYSPGVLRPYPGAELYAECLTYGFEEPKTLRGWAKKKFDFGLYVSPKDMPWINHPSWLQNYQIYLHLASLRLTSKLLKKKQGIAYAFFGELSLFRIKHKIFFFALEPKLLVWGRKMFISKSD